MMVFMESSSTWDKIPFLSNWGGNGAPGLPLTPNPSPQGGEAGLSGSFHLEKVRRAAVMVAAQAGNGSQSARIDAASLVENRVVDVHQQHFADDQIARERPVAQGN